MIILLFSNKIQNLELSKICFFAIFGHLQPPGLENSNPRSTLCPMEFVRVCHILQFGLWSFLLGECSMYYRPLRENLFVLLLGLLDTGYTPGKVLPK